MKRTYIVFLLLMSCHVFADTFRVALPDEDYPPFYFSNAQNKGILNEVILLFSKDSGLEIDYVYVPEMRSAKLVHDNLVDARMESELWAAAPKQYYWSAEIVTVEDILVVGRGVNPASFQQQSELKQGVLLGRFGYVYPRYEQLEKDKFIHRENFYADLAILQSLYNDTQMDKRFAVMSRSLFRWYSDKYPDFKALNVSEFYVGKAPLQLQFSFTPRGQALATEFNIFLKKLKDTGELDRIITRYQ